MEATTEKNIATFTHLSALTQYFIPLGIIFSHNTLTSKKKTEFVDYSKQILNFQLSVLLYCTLLIAIPGFDYNDFYRS
jgi:uncharacterized Tic20 family protein